MRKTPEYFDEVFVLAKEDITKQYTAIFRDASMPKLKLVAETFHIHPFLLLFS